MSKRQRNDKLIGAAGWRLRQIREACGLSQERVLFETNIHLSNIENGRHDITIATLVELCRYYEISLHDFFKGMKYARTATD